MNHENKIINHLGMAPGDTIVVPKSGWEIVQHFALYLGQDHYGKHYMCENDVKHGVKLTDVADFFKENLRYTRIEKFQGNKFQRKATIQAALSKLGSPYSLINYNCEHFVNEVRTRIPSSNQVENAFVLALAGLLVGIALKK
jgi:hypothetical protein